ncbi:hypothetical protein MA9V2_082 [Chryseobacterium phage MA9V-2]|nr:hypothetical protein MA9V2_082 [Chryseobacterium phage MA9V-2]
MRADNALLINTIRNNKAKASNTRFLVSDALDALNQDKFGAEDTYTKEQINALVAGQMGDAYVPMIGTTTAKPFTGGLYGRPTTIDPLRPRSFNIGMRVPNDPTSYGLNIQADTRDANNTGYTAVTNIDAGVVFNSTYYDNNAVTKTAKFKADIADITLSLSDVVSGVNGFAIEKNNIGFTYHAGQPDQYIINMASSGLYATKQFVPTSDNHFVQKKWVVDAIAGNTPQGFVPLAGTTAMSGQIIYTSNLTPTDGKALVQKQWVDTQVATKIPLAGSANITGGLTGTTIFAPTNNNSFVQKGWVDGAISTALSGIGGFVPLTGTNSSNPITGNLYGKGNADTIFEFGATSTTSPKLSMIGSEIVGVDKTEIITYVDKNRTEFTNNVFQGNSATIRTKASIQQSNIGVTFIYANAATMATATNRLELNETITASVYSTGSQTYATYKFEGDGFRALTYIVPASDNHYVQRKFVNDSINTAISGIAMPFIPLAGSTSITGGLVGTAQFTPTSDNAFVQKKWVTDAIAASSGGGNFIPLTGTTTTPVSGRIEFKDAANGTNTMYIGTPLAGQRYGIALYSTVGPKSIEHTVNVDEFNYQNSNPTATEFANINASTTNGAKISSSTMRGDSAVTAYGQNVKISANPPGTSDGVNEVTFAPGHTFTDQPRDNTAYGASDFIQKDYHDYANSWELFTNRKIGGIADMDGNGVNSELYTIMVKQTFTASQTIVNIDVSNFNPRRIFKVEGIAVDSNSKNEMMLNAFHPVTKRTTVILVNDKPDHIELTSTGDNFDGYALVCITYIK